MNPSETFSAPGTRQTDMQRQGAHGIEDSLSYYEGRVMPFQVEIHAEDRATLVSMEQALRKQIALSVNQSYSGDDGYRLIKVNDEDGLAKQIYGKLISEVQMEMMQDRRQRVRRCSFVMRADDPTLYEQTLSDDDGPESFNMTSFIFPDSDLPTFKDGDLPTFQDDIYVSVTVNNTGTFGASPLITIDGPTTDPVVTNQTTGVKMELSRNGGVSLATGERIEIDVGQRTISKIAGTTTDLSDKLSTDSDWLYLTPGTNDLTLADDTTDDLSSQLTVEWRNSWI
jgi:hypothetical protein